MGRTSRSVTHAQISPGQGCLTSEFFGDQFLKKKLQLVCMSILLILLSSRPGCHILTSLRDRCPRRSIPSQDVLSWPRPIRLVPAAHVRRPCVQCQWCIPDARALTRHAPVHMAVASAPPRARSHARALTPVCVLKTARVGSDTIL